MIFQILCLVVWPKTGRQEKSSSLTAVLIFRIDSLYLCFCRLFLKGNSHQEGRWCRGREGRRLPLRGASPDAPAQQLLPSSKSETLSFSSCVNAVCGSWDFSFLQTNAEGGNFKVKYCWKTPVFEAIHKRVLLQSFVHIGWLLYNINYIFLSSMMASMQIVSVTGWHNCGFSRVD